MPAIRLSDDQRRIISFFVDNPPEDEAGMTAAVKYLEATSAFMADSLRAGGVWYENDTSLVLKMAKALNEKADDIVTTPKFWATVQAQLSNIHPELSARPL